MKKFFGKSTKCKHVFDAFDPYHPFPSSLRAIIFTEVLSVRMMKCTRHLFFVLVDLARLYRSEQIGATKIIVSLLPSCYSWSFLLLLVRVGFGVSSDNFEFLTKFKAKLAFRVFVIVDASFLGPNSRS